MTKLTAMNRTALTKYRRRPNRSLALSYLRCVLLFGAAFSLVRSTVAMADELIWIEGEDANRQQMNRHPWYDDVDRSQLSGGELISNFSDQAAGTASYQFNVNEAGKHVFWIRTNPIASTLSYQLNDAPPRPISTATNQRDAVNIAADGKPDLRFLSWIRVGEVTLDAGSNEVTFRLDSENHHHGYLDCLVFATTTFQPNGKWKPGEQSATPSAEGWFAFRPDADGLNADGIDANQTSAIDLRFLNESQAGERGRIVARDGRFWHGRSDQPVRFWAVNGPPEQLTGVELQRCARQLARYGVNLVRVHKPIFLPNGEPNEETIRHHHEIVRVMKAEGIYVHFSFYFPLWFNPAKDLDWLPGYDGSSHPFATLMFNPEFQDKYRDWLAALLNTPDATTGVSLASDPAVFGIELQNEDSFFFWTFSPENLPEPQRQLIESQFAHWMITKYGSIANATKRWNSSPLERDRPDDGRMGIRPLWNIANERTTRDQDTAAFLLDTQTGFYRSMVQFARDQGFEGLITASNWHTASPERFGPLEKLSYMEGDFVDRHGYFSCNHRGENAAWSIRAGHTFGHRSALRLDDSTPGGPKQFTHPVMDIQYNDKPSMISETTFTRPNRYRSEAPLYYAAYGALQDSDSLVHFAFDGMHWQVQPRFWMQPWTLASPSMMGQFPAAALLYRRGLVSAAPVVAQIDLSVDDLRQLRGTPLPEGASFDELRAQDVPVGLTAEPGQPLDPLMHYVGRVQVRFVDTPGKVRLDEAISRIDRAEKMVHSATDELRLDYAAGLLTINSAKAQGLSGNLSMHGVQRLRDVEMTSPQDLIHLIAVAWDDQPLETSSQILLQVMTEEQTNGFETKPVQDDLLQIQEIGTDPWQVREIEGTVRFLRPDAAKLRVTALDHAGRRSQKLGWAEEIKLLPETIYYLIEKMP
ncbi:hypothetical protein [Neorhodopirellula pilleata]|uniref:hypothetical protein n=1 Tax=Neorhodopirellula pilleata TaxID=2714738 RepID=UPI0011B499F3|nr:hypothetical protein [Neorhodopirellula pilleata]